MLCPNHTTFFNVADGGSLHDRPLMVWSLSE